MRRTTQKPGGLCGDQGLYRLPRLSRRALRARLVDCQAAPGQFLTAVMDAAVAVLDDRSASARPELVDVLSEFFLRRYRPGGMFAGKLALIDLPGFLVLCERIETSPLRLEGIWVKHGQEETALERLQKSWPYGTGERTGDEQDSAQETPALDQKSAFRRWVGFPARSSVPPQGVRGTIVSASGSGKTIVAPASALEYFPEGRIHTTILRTARTSTLPSAIGRVACHWRPFWRAGEACTDSRWQASTCSPLCDLMRCY